MLIYHADIGYSDVGVIFLFLIFQFFCFSVDRIGYMLYFNSRNPVGEDVNSTNGS